MKILIKNAKTLLLDVAGDFVVQEKNIYVDGNKIVSLDDAPEGFVPEKTINGEGKLAMPGLINAHTHVYMSLFRNYADDQAFWDWLENVLGVEDGLTEEDSYWGTLLGIMEMLRTGTTCFVDMNIKSAQGVKTGERSASVGAAYESGMRAVITRGLSGEANSEESLWKYGQVVNEIDLFQGEERVRFWMGPHAPYSCMKDYLEKLTATAKKYNIGNNIHLSESESEVENMIKEHGVTPIKYVEDIGVFDVPTIAAHCVNATEDDMDIFVKHGVSVALNPKSNMKLGNGFAPAEKMLEKGVNLCLGTDGPGSNNTQNMFAEMNTAALIYKGANKKAQCISAQDVLKFATINGAKAIGREGELGEIKVGAFADIILLDLNVPQFQPENNIVSGLVYSSNGSEVETVIVDGEVLMEDRKFLTIDEEKVYKECAKRSKRLGMMK